mmetsp:Transcript_56525/g.150649  ORF Transcript_56525/g.150649 Transcript_56525/m.150649 type:complete len:208 (+) Transcript_56525:1610-2233(+)
MRGLRCPMQFLIRLSKGTRRLQHTNPQLLQKHQLRTPFRQRRVQHSGRLLRSRVFLPRRPPQPGNPRAQHHPLTTQLQRSRLPRLSSRLLLSWAQMRLLQTWDRRRRSPQSAASTSLGSAQWACRITLTASPDVTADEICQAIDEYLIRLPDGPTRLSRIKQFQKVWHPDQSAKRGVSAEVSNAIFCHIKQDWVDRTRGFDAQGHVV